MLALFAVSSLPVPTTGPSVSRPFLYPLVRWIARVAAQVYFGRLEVSNGERVPARGPVILAANHPQSITDAMVLGLATPRVVHYVAHSGLFADPLRGLLLRGGGVIPIHRPSDTADAATRNRESFRACRELLERGGCIGIFPEGTSQQERRVQRFKTGTVRIALEAESGNDFGLGIRIVPVGLNFQSNRHFRSRVLVNFGEPLRVEDWRRSYESDPEGTVRDLTEVLQDRIRHRVVEVRRHELEDFVREVEKVYKGDLLGREGLAVPGRSRFERDLALSREIARATDWFYENRPETLWSIGELLSEYRRRLDRLRLPDRIVRAESEGFRRQAGKLVVLFLLGLPFAAWGTLWNYLPYRWTGWIARRVAPDPTKLHFAQIVVGAGLFLAFYGLWFLLASSWLGTWSTVAFLLSLPPTGIFARWYAAGMRRRRTHLRWAYLRSTRGLLVQRLRSFRQEIIDAMDDALDEYLARTGSVPSRAPQDEVPPGSR